MIRYYNKHEFKKIEETCKYASLLLNDIEYIIKPGISTLQIDEYAKNFFIKHKLRSACYLYQGKGKIPFPGYVCTSVNHVICHGIPSEKTILKDGDIVKVDTTIELDGFYADTCKTFKVGKVSKEISDLVDVTKNAMHIGINTFVEGNYIGDIGYNIQKYINNLNKNYGIVEDYCGHGIGDSLHQDPEVQNVGFPKTGPKIQVGMCITVEPMINLGTKTTRLLQDGWTVITNDYKPSAQFEHTIGLTEEGLKIFTLY